jgi:hypothetical protein
VRIDGREEMRMKEEQEREKERKRGKEREKGKREKLTHSTDSSSPTGPLTSQSPPD